MIFKSEHMTQASGSIAGVTYGRAKGGTLYRRARAIPVNPNTTFQSQVRNALTSLVNRWTETLTATQRNAWDTYGQNVLVPNKLGTPIPLSGQNWYIANNSVRLQAVAKLTVPGTGIVIDDAPTIYNRGDFTSPLIGVYEAGTDPPIEFTIDNADEWANETTSFMLIFQGRPRNASRNFFAGPYRMIALIQGDATTPPTATQSISLSDVNTYGFEVVDGQRANLVAVVCRGDGRMSTRRVWADVISPI